MICGARLQMGYRPIPYQFLDHLHLGSSAQTQQTAKLCDHKSAGREKARVLSFPKGDNVDNIGNMPNVPFGTHCPHSFNLALNADTLSANFKTVVILPCNDKLIIYKINYILYINQ